MSCRYFVASFLQRQPEPEIPCLITVRFLHIYYSRGFGILRRSRAKALGGG